MLAILLGIAVMLACAVQLVLRGLRMAKKTSFTRRRPSAPVLKQEPGKPSLSVTTFLPNIQIRPDAWGSLR
jgi:hypothetical protein